MLYLVTQAGLRIWKRPWLDLPFLGLTHPLRLFSAVLLCCLLVLSVALENTEARVTPFFSSGKMFWFVFLSIFSVTGSDFVFQETSYSLFHDLCLPCLTFFLRVWDDVFLFFPPASTELVSDLYSVPYLTFSHVCSVLYRSVWLISSVLLSLGSHCFLSSAIFSPWSVDLLSCLWALVLLDLSFVW